MRTRCQAGADGEIVATGRDGLHQHGKCVQAGGQIHVHIAEDVRVAFQPDFLERASAPLLGQPQNADVRILPAKSLRDGLRAIRRGIVRYDDLSRGGDLAREKFMQLGDAPRQPHFLVENRDDDEDAHYGVFRLLS